MCWVRIVLRDDGAQCQVGGVAHRRPVVRSVSLATARSLVASGVPSVIRRHATSVVEPSPHPVMHVMPAGADRS